MPRGGAPTRPWSRGDIAHLRWYAERGFSTAEAAKMLDRTHASVLIKAGYLGIHFHGPAGAPFANVNGASTRFSDMRQPARH